MKPKYHPACLLFPKLGKEELQELAEDIKARGLLHDIVLYKGRVLDGRNRLAACEIAKVKPRFVEWDGKGSPTEWVISENLIRRHLTSSQRAVIALDLLPLLEKEAKDRQRLSEGRGRKVARKLATFSGNGEGKASQVAARLTKTNSNYIESLKAIKKHAPELLEKVRSGDLKIPDAAEIAKLSPARRKEAMGRLDNGQPLNGKSSYVFQAGTLDNLRPTNITTPPGVCRFLYDMISPHYKVKVILDPCSGKNALTRPWKKAKVIAYELKKGKDFFSCPSRINCDLLLCNPPFSGGGKTRQSPVSMFLERILAVVPPKTPIALVCHWSFRMDQDRKSSRWRWLRDECPEISSIITLPHDIWGDAKVHSEILLFNMPKLKPHYFLPDRYLK